MKIAHVVNPARVPTSSDLFKAQPITLESMRRARQFSRRPEDVELFAIGYPEDMDLVSDGFRLLPALSRSVLDCGSFKIARKLPLLADILTPLSTHHEYDYVVYTNSDIALMPYFYDYLFEKIANGSDSMVVNRRVIEKEADFAIMYSELGKSHPGSDCFVFRRELISKFVLGNTCVGANWIGRALLSNLVVFSEKVEIIKNGHLTFHIGDDSLWLTGRFTDYDLHNKKVAYSVIASLLDIAGKKEHVEMLLRERERMDRWDDVALRHKVDFFSKVKRKLRSFLK